MKFATKIDAIKKLRQLGSVQELHISQNLETGRYEIENSSAHLGLKDAKDIIEGMMELGVRYFLEEELRKAIANQLKVPETSYDQCQHGVLYSEKCYSCNGGGI